MISVVFHLIFVVAVGYKEFKKRKNDFIVKALFAMLKPRANESTPGLSKATRTASRTLCVNFEHSGSEYELILPVAKKKRWKICMAEMESGEVRDVTTIVEPRAGPYRNFFGIELHASQLVRGAKSLRFFDKKGREVLLQ